MRPEEVAPLLVAAAQWGAEEQSTLNTALLSIIVALIGLIGWGIRVTVTKAFSQIQQSLDEIHKIKIDVARHDEAIENLQNPPAPRRR